MAADQLFAAWRTFFERIAEQRHRSSWCSRTCISPTRACSTSSTTSSSGAADLPIFVVTLARPDLLERRPDWGAGKRNFTSIHLEPLPRADMRELSPGLVPGLPAAAVGDIVARADGIPLYAVETVRMLLARGPALEQDGVYVPDGDLTTWPCPRPSRR